MHEAAPDGWIAPHFHWRTLNGTLDAFRPVPFVEQLKANGSISYREVPSRVFSLGTISYGIRDEGLSDISKSPFASSRTRFVR